VTELPFPVFLGAMLPIHLAIGLVEGVVTASVLIFVYEARPELLWTGAPSGAKTASGTETAGTAQRGRLSRRAALGALLAAAVVTAGGLSLLASSFPDGLEWSIQRLTGSTELEAAGGAAAAAERIQSATAFLPDYAFPNSDSALGTSVSGLAGGAIVIALCLAAGYALRLFRHRERAGADR
ncbi:MAG: PDGLE domain-containing protein, partial [Oscillibacter sp.]|nr:PDGLE domain-containing protein [Oscillibacter sp.]